MTHPMESVTALVVTYNRMPLLSECLKALASQTARPGRTVVVDNASTDGTLEALASKRWTVPHKMDVLCLDDNQGGAGGFAAGIQHAIESGADWIWMMDDDASPHPDALERLMQVATSPNNVYGSLAVNGEHTAWTVTLVGEGLGKPIDAVVDVPILAPVESLPFLGFLIHRTLVERIGLPDAGFFIAADDTEYCVRARTEGAQLLLVGDSRIDHPRAQRRRLRVLGRDVSYLSLAPWKRYYDTRNRLLIARKYYGLRLLTRTLPGTFVRLVAAMAFEQRRASQLWAFAAGVIDGLLGRKGRRHARWRIHQ